MSRPLAAPFCAILAGLLALPWPAWADEAGTRAREITSRLTLEEKVSLMGTASPAVSRLGIPAFNWAGECVHGVVAEGASIFPQAIALASTWDPELIGRVASTISSEARVLNRQGKAALACFSPVLNISRDPRWGRVQETYGEDPLLVSAMGLAFIRGLQGDDPNRLKVSATAKHFAANNEEDRRHNGSATVGTGLLDSYYFPHFARAVREGRVSGIMCAYNALNGTPCCASRGLLNGKLRKDWGFAGYVVTDCGAIGDMVSGHHTASNMDEAVLSAVQAGVDLDCGNDFQQRLAGLVKAGRIPEPLVDQAVERLLRIRILLGDLDPPEKSPWASIPDSVVDSPASRELARETARKSVVLLRNPGNLLPFTRTPSSIAVIGPSAAVKRLGDYSGWGTRIVTPLEGIRALVPPGIPVRFARGCDTIRRTPITAKSLRTGPSLKTAPGLRGEYFLGTGFAGKPVLVRTVNRVDFEWPGALAPLAPNPAGYSIRWSGWLVSPVTGRLRIAVTAGDAVRLAINGKVVLDEWIHRPTTTDVREVSLEAGKPVPVVLEHALGNQTTGISLGWDYEPDSRALDEAVALAKSSDVCVVVVGTDRITENEGTDRPGLALPGDQAELVRRVVAANPRTAVVLECGSVVTTGWAGKESPAVLQAWFPGEEGGTAIAEILFGLAEPGGRLPLTWYASEKQLPPMKDYDITRGRTYMYLRKTPAYPFGFGLGYTTFAYTSLTVTGSTASVGVKNTGNRDGDEVVQCYLSGAGAGKKAPIRRLAGFQRVRLKAGEMKSVAVSLEKPATPGKWLVMAGPNSATGITTTTIF
jgi:beta-glucosidase